MDYHSLCVVLSCGFWQMHNVTDLYYNIIQNNFSVLKISCAPIILPSFFRTPGNTSLLTFFSRMSDSIQPFHTDFFHLAISLYESSISFHGLIPHFFLLLKNIPLPGCTTGDLSIHPLKDTLITSKVWQLRIKLV